MRTIVLIALLLGCVGTAGAACSGRQQAEPATYGEAAAQAFAEAERAYGRKDYELARSRFSEVFQSYPFSQYAATAEFRIGDCYLAERLYVRAIEVYRRFVRIHPTNELVAEAQYKIALAYVEQMPRDWFALPPSYERDLTETESAHRALQLFVGGNTDSEFIEAAQEQLARTTFRLASYELYVAEFYTQRGNPTAAARRAEYLMERYPAATQVPDALFLFARAMLELGDLGAARVALNRLVDEYPESPLAVDAEGYIRRHDL